MHAFRVFLLAASIALVAGGADVRAQAPPNAAENLAAVQTLFDEGRAALSRGDPEEAAKQLYAALQTLRKYGYGASTDAGVIAAWLATALDKLDHPQTDEAFAEAADLLAGAPDPDLFIQAMNARLTRLHRLGRAEQGDEVAQRIVQRLAQPGVEDDRRIAGLNVVLDYFSTTGRTAQADKALETLGPMLSAQTPRAARIRGIARFGLARAARNDGRVNDFVHEIEAAIEDLRKAAPETAALLGGALNLRGKMLFEEGLYLQAAPLFAEAASLLANAPDSDEAYVEAASMQARMLSRIERNQEALALVDRLVGEIERRTGPDSRFSSSVRLDRVEMLMNAGKRDEALRQLEAVRERLGGKADPFIAAQYFDRLAALEIAEEDYPAAAKSAERAIEAYRIAFPKTPAFQLEPMRKRAHASEGLLDRAYADQAFRELVDLSTSVYRPEHPEVARDLNAYAAFLQIAGRLEEAEGLLRRALVGLERAYGSSGLKYAYGLNNLAQTLSIAGRHAEAASLLEQALALVADAPDHASTRAMLSINYANALNFLDRADEALAILGRARAELQTAGEDRERYVVGVDVLGVMSLAHLGRLEESWREGALAYKRMRIRTKEDAQNAVNLLIQMADTARRAGDDENTLAAASEASRVMTSQGVETDRLWREWAQVSLPSLWRLGQK